MTPVDSSRYANSAEPDVKHSDPFVEPDGEDSTSQASLAPKSPKHSKSKHKRKVSLFSGYIFVLWGAQFDEIAAAIFITQLRDIGLRVKVVSPARKKMLGEYGVGLFSDNTIERALRFLPKVVSIVIPCGLKGAETLQDERFSKLFEEAHSNQIKFLISDIPKDTLNALSIFPSSMQQDDFIIYPEHEQLIDFVHELPQWLPSVLAS